MNNNIVNNNQAININQIDIIIEFHNVLNSHCSGFSWILESKLFNFYKKLYIKI